MTDVNGRLASLSLEERALLFERLRERRERGKQAGRGSREGPAPLSFAQQRLWFLDRLAPGSPLYNVPTALRLAGPLDPAVLAACFGEIVRRHEALRTRFEIREGGPVQTPEPAAPFPLPVIDLAGLPPDLRGREEERRIEEEIRAPFDLTRPPLLRARLVRLGEDEHLLLLTVHHIASDAWSIGVAVGELGALYPALAAGRPSPLPELPIQYSDFAREERERLRGDALAREVAFWRGKLAGAEAPDLPTDRPRPAVPRFRGASLEATLPPPLDGAVRAWAQAGRATLFMALLAPFSAFLARITGGDDAVLGTTVTGRGREEVSGLIGFFVNTLVLRTDLSGDPDGREILARARVTTLEAFTHQEIPFEKLIDELGLPRDPHRPPLLGFVLQLLNLPGADLALPGLAIASRPLPNEWAKFDLLVNGVDTPEGLRLEWHYDTGLFEGATIVRLSRAFETLLAGLVADPARRLSDLPLLTGAERHQLVAEWNEAPAGNGRGRAPIHHLFEAQADRSPDAVAVSRGEERLTYRELDVRANRLARHLAALGVRPGDLVALVFERSLGMVEAILAALKAGAGYLPLDPAYPPERLEFALADSGARLVLTEERVDAEREAIAAWSGERLALPADPELPAYVIYTSGSTGRPKGVVIPHGNVTRLFAATAPWFGFGPGDVWTLFHSYAFDFSVWEIWGALLHGGRLVVVPYWETRSPQSFYGLLRDERVTVLNQTPSAFRQLLWAEEAALGGAAPDLALRFVIFGGEALEPGSLAPWIARHGDERPLLVNMYGITETTVHVTWRPLRRGDLALGSVIGRPIPDLSLHVLDRSLRLQPLGVPGEICVGGEGLALGYLGRPELTAERFVPDPFGPPGSRLYRSGDLARRRPDGEVESLGRIDHQVKIRGFRIEPGEVEAALARHPAVRESAVAVRGGRLVAWVVPGSGEAPTLSALRESLAISLPEPMLPGGLVLLDSLPLTANGKVDRRALPDPGTGPVPDREHRPPETRLERFLAGLFAEVLRLPPDRPAGLDDDFFELGGSSITGALLVNRLQEALAEIVHVVAIFDAPTVAELAAYVTEQHPRPVERLWGGEAPEWKARPAERPAGPADVREVRRLIALGPSPEVAAEEAKNPPAVFVLSPPRSGSTLLRVMLAGHPRLFAPPELELLSFGTLAERRAAFSGRDAFWLEGVTRAVMEALGCGAEEAEQIVADRERRGWTTLRFYRELQEWLGGRRLVDKTPSYALDSRVLRRAEEGFDRALYLHLVRHPQAAVRSFEEAKLDQIFFRREHPFSRRRLAELIWTVSHRNVLDFLAGVPEERRRTVHFENLVRDPEQELAGICDFLGIDLRPEMADPYRPGVARMTDGVHPVSRMLGDVKLLTYSRVDPAAAERWRKEEAHPLGEPTLELAGILGYGLQEESKTAPLSFSQERLWFLDRLTPGAATYNLPTPFRLRGPLDPAVLARCFDEIVRRHEALRTRFEERDGTPLQVIDPPRPRPLPVADLSALPEPRRQEEAHRLTAAEAGRPFDLRNGPLLRTALLRLSPQEHDLLLNAHHVVSDGWSVRVLSKELATLYEAFAAGRPSPLPELRAQYADFARGQRERLSGAELERQLAYWRARLEGDPPSLDLPFDRPRPALQTYRGASASTVLPRELSEGLKRIGLASRASLFMTLLAGFEVLLHRMSGQDDVLVGTPVAGRVRADVEELIGFFLNTLVLRTGLSGNPGFRELLLRVRETAVGAYAHQEVPFEKLLEALQPERDLSRTPLFQVFFNLANFPDLGASLPGGLTVEPLGGVEAESKFDLTVYAAEIEEGLRLHLVYNADLFAAPRIEEMLRQYHAVLERVVEDPEARVDEISLVTPEAEAVLPDPRAFLGEEWRGAVHELFAERARRHPDRPAVSDPEGSWTYGELARAAEGLAARLREAGVEKGDRVAVWAHRSAPMAWAVMGTLRAGGAFVMLDPAYPAARIVEMLRLAAPRAFLQIAAAGEPPAEVEAWLREAGTWRLTLRRGGLSLPETAPAVETGPDDLAYIAFTSGSTGVPKGILGRHGPLSHFLPWQAERFGLTEEDRYSLLSGLAHDPLQRDLFTPLATGASLAAPSPDDLLVPGRLAAWAAREGITVAHLTPALGRVLTEPAGDGRGLPEIPSLRWVLLVGDVLTRLDVDRLRRIAPRVTCVNLYGSTETQRAVAYHVVEEGGFAQVLPLGRGMRDVQLLVLRPAGPPALAGIGEVGEICVRSPHLAAGYLGDEAGTRERFRTNPWTGRPGDRLYRTGDLGRYLPDGQVTFAGRADQQVKIRGFRIELGEIDAALGRLAGVKEAVVLAREDGPHPADRRLVAYVVPGSAPPASAGELRQALATRLPAYMVPSAVVFLDRMPVTPNGKVDRRALPAPEAGGGAGLAEPTNELERAVAEVFREVLGVPRVGRHDDFFRLGGHSLLGTSLLSRLRGRFGVEIPLRALFEEPTVERFSRRIGERLRSEGPEPAAYPTLLPRAREGDPPLSFAQQRLWFLERLMPGNPFYNLSGGGRLTGPLEAGVLQRAVREVVRRHEALRTGFAEEGGRPVQRIAPEPDVGVPVVDLSALAPEAREAVVRQLAAERAREPFDLARPGLLRLTLLRLERSGHVLLWTLHHIVSDAWSNGVLTGEVASLYAGQALPELPVQYADFAVWQREWLSGETLARQLAYWRGRLSGAPVVELPADRPRPPVQTFRGATYRAVYGRPLLDSLGALARRGDASVFMTLLAAFDVLLCRFTGQEDVLVGSPIANRTQPVLERLIGFFINTLVLRTDCTGDPSFGDLLARVKEVALGAYAHQDLPFEQLVEDLQPRRDLSRNPLFQVMLNLLNTPPPQVEVTAGLEMSPLPPSDGTALFDLQAYVLEEPGGLRIAWEHNTDLFDRGTIERLSRSFEALLSGIVERPEARLQDLPLLSAEERRQILAAWNGTAAPLPEQATVHALFEAQVARTPHAVALVFEGESLTYAGLNARANRVAHRLRRQGVGPDVLVGLRLERSVSLVVAVLAVLKAGGAYLPLDPGHPAERLAWVLEDSAARLVLTGLESAEDPADPAPLAGPGNLAYVLYTSGSTGRPKGVEVTHGGVVNFLTSVARRPGLTADDAVLAVTTLSFDIAGYELLLPLTVGARIVLVTREAALDGERLAAVLSSQGVTRVQVTPATWRLLLGSGWAGDARLMAFSGGEALPRDLARELLPKAGSLWNFYGPTETTIWSSVHRVEEADGPIPIGLPIANTAIHLLDRRMEPVPLGVPGELYIGGAGVARGYLRRPDLTAERFVPDPFASGERLYRTGDLARRLPSGEIDFLGRADHQVKIRGFRVEPGEIEAVLAEDPAVRQAAVILREDGREDAPGGPRLVAYVVPEEAGDLSRLRDLLASRLPAYMIPSAFIPLPALPLTPSGKVDRRALASREDVVDRPLSFAVPSVPPRTPAERQMAGLFAEVLGLRGDRVGAHDNFFERGGHSLLATRLVSRVRAAFGVDLPLRALFEAPTVAGLTAAALAEGRGAEEPGIRRLHATEAPLSFSQERLWFLERLTPGTATYALPSSVRLRGPLDPAALSLAFEEIVRRHEALRTRFLVRAGVPVQVVDPPGRHPLPLVDLAALPEPELRSESGRLAREEAARPFDLEAGPVLRTTLLRLGAEEHGLLVAVHHIATDGWSQSLLLRELAVLYEAFSSGAPSSLPELPVQYADYAVWQRERLTGEALAQQLAYWRERLGGSPSPLDLPLDRPRPAIQTFRGGAVAGALSRELSGSLARLALSEGASLFMVLLAGFELLLHRQSGQDDVLVGIPIAGRLRPEVEDLIGFFLNTLVLRTDLGGRPTFRELLRRVRETALSAYAYQDVPFEKLLEELQPERDLSRTPLFQVFFNMLNLPSAELRLPGGLSLEPLGGGAGDSKFDLTVYVAEGEEGTGFNLVYNADLFDEARMEELLRQYRVLLSQAVEHPDAPVDRISLLTSEAVHLLPDPAAPLGDAWRGAVHALFAERARRHPERPALTDSEGTSTYGELAYAARRLAARLRASGVEKGDRVAVWAHRSSPVVWAVLATLEAGAAFVMLDPAYPAPRIVEMLRLASPRAFLGIAAAGDPPPEVEAWIAEAGLACRITLPGGGARAARELVASLPEALPAVEMGPDDLAYVAFTSGSTGTPKGILGRHGPLSHFLPWQAERFGLGAGDRYSLLSGLAHDPLQRDLFTPLCLGGTVVVPTFEEIATPGRLAAWMAREGITVAHLTPALGQILTEPPGRGEEPALIPALRWVLLVGDVLTRLDVDRIRRIAPRATCVNLYGSTETQRAVAFHVVETGGTEADRIRQVLPLGRGMEDVQLLVVRPGEEPALAGIGEVGEIWVRSPHLAAGYLGDEALTRDRFRPNPWTGAPGDRIYRTGDLGRYLPDGQVAFAGRADQQVKIRGFRIELGEIEAALGRLPGVREAVVILRQDGPDPSSRRLAAYVVPDPERPPEVAALREALRAGLPAYMVPAAFVFLDRLPVTPNRKVDRRALPIPEEPGSGSESGYVEPGSDVEQTIAEVWREVLGVERVGVRHNFFDLGGHSLLLVRLHARLQEALGRELALVDLFNYPNIRALAEHLGRQDGGTTSLGEARSRGQRQMEAARRQRELARTRKGPRRNTDE